jgi:hypothetical protein
MTDRKKLPSGHAYMRFRNNGYAIHVDFPEKNLPFLDKIIRMAMKAYGKDEAAHDALRSATKGISDE